MYIPIWWWNLKKSIFKKMIEISLPVENTGEVFMTSSGLFDNINILRIPLSGWENMYG